MPGGHGGESEYCYGWFWKEGRSTGFPGDFLCFCGPCPTLPLSVVSFLCHSQYIKACKTGNMDQALSLWFLLGWIGGDSCNLIGSFLADQLPLQVGQTAGRWAARDSQHEGPRSSVLIHGSIWRGPHPVESAFRPAMRRDKGSVGALVRASVSPFAH